MKLRTLRLQRKLTLKQAAEAAGLKSKSSYRNIETGFRDPSWEVAQRLESYFCTPASELLADRKEETFVN